MAVGFPTFPILLASSLNCTCSSEPGSWECKSDQETLTGKRDVAGNMGKARRAEWALGFRVTRERFSMERKRHHTGANRSTERAGLNPVVYAGNSG